MCLCDKELYWVWTGPNWLFCCLSSLEGNSLSHWDCSDVNLSLDWGSGRADSHTSLSCSYYDWSWVCRMTEWGHTKQEVIKRSRETTTTSSKRWSPAQRRCSNWMRGRRKELRLIMIYFLVDRVVFLSLSPVAVTSLVVTCQSGCGWRRLPRWLPVTVHLAEGPLTPRVVPPPTPRADSPDCHLASAANYCTLFLKILYYYSYLYYYYWYYRHCQWVHWAWPLLFKSILKTYFLSVVLQGLRSEVTSICKVNSYNLFSYNSIFVALTLTDNWLF